MCNPNCHIVSNNGISTNGSSGSNSEAQPAYRLIVNVPSHPFGVSITTVGISITTENGYRDQADPPTTSGSSYTFNIPKNEGKSDRFVLILEILQMTGVIPMRLQAAICQFHYHQHNNSITRDIFTGMNRAGMIGP